MARGLSRLRRAGALMCAVAYACVVWGQQDLELSPELETFLAEYGAGYGGQDWHAHEGPITFAIVIDGPSSRTQEDQVFISEIQALAGTEFDLAFPEACRFSGNWDSTGVRNALDRALSDPEVDLVLALGFMASIEAARHDALPKPVLAPYIVDAEVLGIEKRQGLSGKTNLVYLTSPNPVLRDLTFFHEMAGFGKVALLASHHVLDAAPSLEANTMELVQSLGFEIQVVKVNGSAAESLAQLEPDTAAVYVLPLLEFEPAEFHALVEGINQRGLPSFSLQGGDDMTAGILATLAPPSDVTRLARRVALYVQRILLGEAPDKLPVDFPVGERLVINMATARQIGFYPDWSYLNEAELLNEKPMGDAVELTLQQAVDRAVDTNADLAAQAQSVEAGRQDIPKAYARLKPTVDAASRGILIDDDLASTLQPQRQWTGSIRIQQVIYNDLALANVQISKRLQEAREHGHEGQRLDLMQLAAEAYLNVLRAGTFEQVQKDDLKVTREHLELARVRQEAGVANPGEVYRWESQLAQSRINALEATSQRELAELQLKRVLGLPQDALVRLAPIDLDSDVMEFTAILARDYLNNPLKLASFVASMVEAGLATAPELQRIDAAISAQDRLVLANRRKYYTPTIAAQGELKHEIAEGGAGTGGGGLMGLLVPGGPETSWTVGVEASLPLYAGGGRKADRVQSRETLEQLLLERKAAEEKLEQRIRSAMEKLRASWPTIRHAEAASAAAQKGLGLVSDAYSRGVVDITDLLDAQNAALTASLGAAGAVYQFLVDLTLFERSIGNFAILSGPEEQARWLRELAAATQRETAE
ncbi:MAG: TolC family protein [Candidatus Hydrogenedentes bacterium]|nr:TolC family protein [Candidatus Hydrogenedentota bacterium]